MSNQNFDLLLANLIINIEQREDVREKNGTCKRYIELIIATESIIEQIRNEFNKNRKINRNIS